MENIRVLPPGGLAPYGGACTNCSKAKVRCVSDSTEDNCERCQRLKKDCNRSETGRKRKVKPAKRQRESKTAQLEEKLNGIVSLLQSATQPIPIAGHPVILSQASTHRNQNKMVLTPAQSIGSPAGCSVPHSTAKGGYEPSLEEAEGALLCFRSQRLKYFPFIGVPEKTTSQQLREERPFLWHCILAISAKSPALQLAFDKEIRATLGQRMLSEGESNLDLLLGTLAYLGWAYCHLHHRPILTTVTQLAISLVFDLGLNKPLRKGPGVVLSMNSQGCPRPPPLASRTIEERRVVISLFLISSIISSYFQRVDSLRWTPYMDECLKVLEQEKHLPTDELLVQQVKLQLILEKVNQGFLSDGMDEYICPMNAPPTFYLKALRSQIQSFKLSIPESLQQNEVLLGQIYVAEITINEIAFSKAPLLSNSPDFERLECLYTCLKYVKNWWDLFFAIPLSDYTGCSSSSAGFSLSTYSQLSHCIITVYRLSTYDDPSWDKFYVRNTINLSDIIEQLCTKLGLMKEAAGIDNGQTDEEVFNQSVRKTQRIKNWWEAKLAAESADAGVLPSHDVGQSVDEAAAFPSFEFTDEAWLKDILENWDPQSDPYYYNF